MGLQLQMLPVHKVAILYSQQSLPLVEDTDIRMLTLVALGVLEAAAAGQAARLELALPIKATTEEMAIHLAVLRVALEVLGLSAQLEFQPQLVEMAAMVLHLL